MAKKDFKKDTAALFISTAEEPQAAPTPAPEGFTVPKGYRLERESKSARMQLLVRPATKEGIKKLADRRGVSMNDMINDLFEEYLERQGIE